MPGLIIVFMVIAIGVCVFWWFESYDLAAPLVIGAIVFVIGGLVLWNDYDDVVEQTILVESKDRGGDDGSYRIYTEGDTLAVADVWFDNEFRRTNSADTFGDIRVCHRYTVLTRGWEFGLFSMMPNIVRIVEDHGLDDECAVANGMANSSG